jgi:hypothetical protein
MQVPCKRADNENGGGEQIVPKIANGFGRRRRDKALTMAGTSSCLAVYVKRSNYAHREECCGSLAVSAGALIAIMSDTR